MSFDAPPEGPIFAEAVGLAYVHDHDPGITRRRSGKGFAYRGPDGAPLKDRAALKRIRELVIPPAWTDVWICTDADGHIQATGRDHKGRKQYLYHPLWRAHRDESKYGRMAAFGRALPGLRLRVDHDLNRHGLSREKVLAAVVRLLEVTLIRIGNDEYAEQNKSFGLTTLRKRHVDVTGAGAVFEFRGKSGKTHRTAFRDRRLAAIVRRCEELPGQRLFQYIDEDGQRRPVGSQEVNGYIREVLGDSFSAKDFRTWAGTLTCALALLEAEPPASQTAAKRAIANCVKQTAARLGNTPAVCRSSYIHPAVFETYAEGELARRLAVSENRAPETALLDFLDTLEGAKAA